ncbi:unnamed protein product [Ranitomeya imitator]|uniref:Uncharacterized protein n=1 Tax=Ranitomeya imitator TaxID=111125 RepID=A0ABN9LVH1_9NEOB|nr:unnamed protein product [Ranitomeya imitator]
MITIDDMEEMDGLSDFTGSVLRLDVDIDGCNALYSIPRSNPHFNSTNQPPEIFAHGLHNPGRCAVDRHSKDISMNLTILCSDSNAKNRSNLRIIQIIKGKDYGEVYILSSSKSMTQAHSGKLYKIIDPKRKLQMKIRRRKRSKNRDKSAVKTAMGFHCGFCNSAAEKSAVESAECEHSLRFLKDTEGMNELTLPTHVTFVRRVHHFRPRMHGRNSAPSCPDLTMGQRKRRKTASAAHVGHFFHSMRQYDAL